MNTVYVLVRYPSGGGVTTYGVFSSLDNAQIYAANLAGARANDWKNVKVGDHINYWKHVDNRQGLNEHWEIIPHQVDPKPLNLPIF